MRCSSLLGSLLLAGAVTALTSCNNSPSLTSIQVTPNAVTATTGATIQFTAIGSYTHPNHPPETKDITNEVTWSTSSGQIVSVNSSGLATMTGLATGTAQVTASMQGFNGLITGSANVSVTASTTGGGGTGSSDITAVSIIPASTTVATLNQTTQFIAIGTTAGGSTVDVTNVVAWNSSNQSIATITNSGLATALASGTTTITAIFTNSDGTAGVGTANFAVAPSGSPEPLVALALIPTSQTALAIGQTAQFIAIGTTGTGTTVDLTNKSAWISSNVSVGTVNSTGLATAVSTGTTAITAIATNPDGTVVTGSASFTVTASTTQEPLLALTIIPTSQTVLSIGETAQYLAIGTFSSTGAQTNPSICGSTGTTQDCTDYVTWVSSDTQVATISTTGLATGLNAGSSAITAMAKNPDGTLVTGAASFTEEATGSGAQQSTLTVTLMGSNAANGQVTAPAPGTTSPLVINCTASTPGGCTQSFPLNSTVTLTATPLNGAQFGGWSSNCTPTAPINPTGTNSCTITLPDNASVAAIFY
ncbi:MAG: Ig-like domain-containing protein [Acidobacteriota bacterium]|nr:Ig-like domain-containing protein [Acidobacteriota bacterium]